MSYLMSLFTNVHFALFHIKVKYLRFDMVISISLKHNTAFFILNMNIANILKAKYLTATLKYLGRTALNPLEDLTVCKWL